MMNRFVLFVLIYDNTNTVLNVCLIQARVCSCLFLYSYRFICFGYRIISDTCGSQRVILRQIMKVKEWGSQKNFILDYCSSVTTTYNQESQNKAIPFIRGRIFPQKDPYCLSSFLVEIEFPPEYPFKPPEAKILDRIYHPNVDENGRHCCCWGFNADTWRSTIGLTGFIEGIIRIIDNVNVGDHGDTIRCAEYERNYDQFYEKALRCTLDYGRSRFKTIL